MRFGPHTRHVVFARMNGHRYEERTHPATNHGRRTCCTSRQHARSWLEPAASASSSAGVALYVDRRRKSPRLGRYPTVAHARSQEEVVRFGSPDAPTATRATKQRHGQNSKTRGPLASPTLTRHAQTQENATQTTPARRNTFEFRPKSADFIGFRGISLDLARHPRPNLQGRRENAAPC